MGKRRWTEKQRQSIEATGGTLLVSAAAGSGKTAVLVERVIRMITDNQNPVDVDRLLIVTFTRAAAAEMRQRLSAALTAKAAAEPENRLYQRQQMLLPQANISTIHGFCATLLREQAGRAGLPPRFRVAEESETILLSSEALDMVLEQSYTQKDPAFLELASQLGGRRNDEALRQAILQAYTFMQAQPLPQVWLEEQLNAYTTVCPMEKTRWMEPLRREMAFALENSVMLATKALALSQREELAPYRDALVLDKQKLESLLTNTRQGTYEDIRRQVYAFSPEKLGQVRGVKDTAALQDKELVQALRKKIKADVGKVQELFCGTEEQCREDLQRMAPIVEALGALVTAYTHQFVALKRQKKLLDYDDLEHECLKLLIDSKTGAPTPLAQELSHRYHQIMVDEYQDTNAAQDALFRALSREESNLFLVGDVKQSIYGFRQAMPSIFTARRDSYAPFNPSAPAYPATITLENNFRSRSTVTDTVNFLFKQLMHRDLGGVTYDEREALVCSAQYPQAKDRQTEWLLLDGASTTGDVPTAEVAEARAIARRIYELLDTMQVKDGDIQRPLTYGDICILMRTRSKAAIYARELNKLGIPAGADSSGSFLTTPEVMTALSLLRVIDNPLREVELTAVMLSPLYGMTADDAARIRLAAGKDLPLYTAVEQQATGADEDDGLCQRCRRLINDLRRARTLAASLPADRLLERLYRDTGLLAVFSARAGGRQRVANLHQLDRLARSFEQGEFRGLSAFIRHIDRLQEQGKDLPAGNAVRSDSVQIMTVHNSKGLEFPVVFLARLHGQMNSDDNKKRLLFHHQAGIGLCLRDEEAMEKHRTLPFLGVLSARRQDDRAEELRVWYVALTRAKEKLILVSYCKDLEAKIAALEAQLPPGRELLPDTLLRATSPADWLLMAALRHPSLASLRQDTASPMLAAQEPLSLQVLDPSLSADEQVEENAVTAQEDEVLCDTLRQRFSYRYPFEELAAVPAKVAASQLSHAALSRANIATARPAFLQADGLTAAQKGTALHTFMQYADYRAAAMDPAAEAGRLANAGFITQLQADVLPLDKLAHFFASALYARMAASPDCHREFHFAVQVPAETVMPGVHGGGETVVVQGIADCVFQEGDGLVLLDYKTDRIKTPEDLIERYRSQLTFYKQALEPILGLPVTEAVLYSFHLGQAILVDL